MARLLPKSPENEVAITISARTFLKVILLIIGVIMILAILRKVTFSLILIFTAFFLALAMNAPVGWVARHLPHNKTGGRALATSISFLIVIVLLAGFLFAIIPPVINQSRSMISSAPSTIKSLQDQNSDLNRIVRRYHLEKQFNDFSSQVVTRLKHASGSVVSTLGKIGSSIVATLTVLVLTFMMLVEGPIWVRQARNLLPEAKRDHASKLTQEMYRVIKGFVNGQVLLAAIAAFMLLPGLLIFHVSYPIALMGIVFICGLIPMVGHTIGAVIVTIIALFHSPVSAVGILIYYILYQQIENYLIQPKVQANTTNLSPLLVFMAVVIGVSFSGLLGGLVAIPIAGCVKVLVADHLQRISKTSNKTTVEET